MDSPHSHRAAWRLMPPTAFFSLGALVWYFAYRLKCLLRAQNLTQGQHGTSESDSSSSFAIPWLFLAVEILSILPNALPCFLRIFAVQQPNRNKDRLAGNEVPTVDILILCCNEDLEIIIDTARAACVLDYPRDRYRVFVCDDGASQKLQQKMQSLSIRYPNLYYTARVKGPVKDYKAGNVNHGLSFSSQKPWVARDHGKSDPPEAPLGGSSMVKCSLDFHDSVSSPPSLRSRPSARSIQSEKDLSAATDFMASEYVAGLDADMIPEPHWLRTMLPHLIDDPQVALACSPQAFYNIPTNDALEQTIFDFADITEVVKDSLGHTDCLGSGYVLRRSAINSIGGFPTQSLTEDVSCSATLLGAGWKTAFVQEPLQYGSVPESLHAHIKQRTRWLVGHVQTALLFNFRLWGERGKHLSITQRIAGTAFDLRQMVQVPLALSYVAIPVALLSGYPLIIWTDTFELKWLIRLVVIWMLCHGLHQAVVGAIAGLRNGWYDLRMPAYDTEQWLGPYIFAAFIRSFILPRRLGAIKADFTSTGSIHNDLREGDAQNRATLSTPLLVVLFHQWVLIHVLFILACLVGVGLAVARCFDKATIPGAYNASQPRITEERFIYLVTRIGWPPLLWLQSTVSAMTPILYMLSPPTNPNREALLRRDPDTHVAYPTMESRQPRQSMWIGWRIVIVAVSFLYTIALVAASTQLESGHHG